MKSNTKNMLLIVKTVSGAEGAVILILFLVLFLVFIAMICYIRRPKPEPEEGLSRGIYILEKVDHAQVEHTQFSSKPNNLLALRHRPCSSNHLKCDGGETSIARGVTEEDAKLFVTGLIHVLTFGGSDSKIKGQLRKRRSELVSIRQVTELVSILQVTGDNGLTNKVDFADQVTEVVDLTDQVTECIDLTEVVNLTDQDTECIDLTDQVTEGDDLTDQVTEGGDDLTVEILSESPRVQKWRNGNH